MLQKILVPVDMSKGATNALRYAVRFAEHVGCPELAVVHVYMPQVDSEYPNFIPPATEFSKFREKQLADFVDAIPEIREARGIKISREVWLGFPADELLKRSKGFSAIIMGTTGEQTAMDKFFGSVSSAIAQRADCPVILVPLNASFEPIHQILYAARFEAAEPGMVQQMLDFNDSFKANLHFVHVRTNSEHQPEAEKEQIFSSLLRNGEPEFSFEITEVEGESVAETLNDYTINYNIDLIVLATKKRNLIEGIFHRSQTRQLMRIARLPVMVLH